MSRTTPSFNDLRDASGILDEYLTFIEHSIQEVLHTTGRTTKLAWDCAGKTFSPRTDEDNRTVWVAMPYGYQETIWLAANTDDFAGTGHPIAWFKGRDPEEVAGSGIGKDDLPDTPNGFGDVELFCTVELW